MNKDLLKLAIIGSVGVPAKYGGFETLVHYLVKNLYARLDITVYCSGKSYAPEEQTSTWNGAKLKYIPLKANGMQSVAYDIWSILHAVRRSDVLLILGVSGCLFLPFLKMFTDKKIIVNIDGLEWRRPKWNALAKAFLRINEKIACKYADEIITDNQILKEYVKIRYGIDGNLIEYGADHCSKVEATEKDREEYPFLSGKYAFKVARIEPENNLHVILKAFSCVPDETLVIVGNWNNSDYGKDLKEYYSRFSNLILLDPIYDRRGLDLLRSNATYYVHGHSAGGTNPSLVEAMYLQLPVLSFDVIYNRVTTNNQALFFHDEESLKQVLNNIHRQPLHAIGRALRLFAERKYTWEIVSNKYAALASGTNKIVVPKLTEPVNTQELADRAAAEPTFAVPEGTETPKSSAVPGEKIYSVTGDEGLTMFI